MLDPTGTGKELLDVPGGTRDHGAVVAHHQAGYACRAGIDGENVAHEEK
jgi:hypothetical protein